MLTLPKDPLLNAPVHESMLLNLWEFPITSSSTMPALPATVVSARPEIIDYQLPSAQRSLYHGWLLDPQNSTFQIPSLTRQSMQTLLRIIKTWPRMLAKGFQTPPFLHTTQINPETVLQPMISCTAITIAWSSQTAQSTHSVRESILFEMRHLFSTYRTYDERNLLAALQAITMYTIMLMYPCYSQVSVSLIDPAIFLCLQRLVSYVVETGLVLAEESMTVRLDWESWVHITAKRTTVFSLYLLHWSYTVYHSLESLKCSKLGSMPAPAAKFLWQAGTRGDWERLYERWLEQWRDEPLTVHELAEFNAEIESERRVETWLEDADELGIMFFGIGE